MNNFINQKPCVVPTPQGFSVSYNDHLLYSKYNPSKLILQTIENLEILPGTIILCISPVLEYGLSLLQNKLTENCRIFCIEADHQLYNFLIKNNSFFTNNNLDLLISPENLNKLPETLFSLASCGKYKRVLKIDFSAGSQFYQQFYNDLYNACTNSIATFWKNRITLTKFGRKYSHNLFTNLKTLAKTEPIEDYFSSITKPIIVFGAGQSLDLFFVHNQFDFNNFHILCADTALQPLLKRNIVPDGVFIEEAQSVITKAFIGAYNNIHLFAGLSSIPNLLRFVKPENISYFTTEYTQAKFLDNLYNQDFMPPRNLPFGSVGLTSVYYSLKFRANENIPVYIVGLDFSYSIGYTHAKETMAYTTRIMTANKLLPIENYSAAYSQSAIAIKDKSNKNFITTPILQSYGDLFNTLFCNVHNLYDTGECGISLAIPKGIPSEITSISSSKRVLIQTSKYNEDDINKYLSYEKSQLIYLKQLLTGNIKLKEQELISEIKKIATEREYLFLHFPDGYCFDYNQSFLNRIRTEIDFFLKVFE